MIYTCAHRWPTVAIATPSTRPFAGPTSFGFPWLPEFRGFGTETRDSRPAGMSCRS